MNALTTNSSCTTIIQCVPAGNCISDIISATECYAQMVSSMLINFTSYTHMYSTIGKNEARNFIKYLNEFTYPNLSKSIITIIRTKKIAFSLLHVRIYMCSMPIYLRLYSCTGLCGVCVCVCVCSIRSTNDEYVYEKKRLFAGVKHIYRIIINTERITGKHTEVLMPVYLYNMKLYNILGWVNRLVP